jgi:hypothetical protein
MKVVTWNARNICEQSQVVESMSQARGQANMLGSKVGAQKMRQGFIGGLMVGVILAGAVLSFSWHIASPADASEVGSQGRYQMLMSTLNASDVFLVDTGTGRIWQRTEFTDVQGDPEAWRPMPKFDNLAEELEWLRVQPRKSNR